MINNQTIANAEHKDEKIDRSYQKELATIRTGHASPSLIEHLR